MCDAAEALVVKISAVWTSALACAGGRPNASKAVFERTPKAMPRAPSTSCAPNPTAKNNHQVSKEIAPPELATPAYHAFHLVRPMRPFAALGGIRNSTTSEKPRSFARSLASRLCFRARATLLVLASIVRGCGHDPNKIDSPPVSAQHRHPCRRMGAFQCGRCADATACADARLSRWR